ncbi:hypothetical protein M9458_057587 [Cirrhinus mrigala]|uniref:Uncharacterized protein n=1 Tax=Cirrhinus mrigala TaxID=683832 RepID=A0ABD0MFM1_CIRMR
MDQGSDLSVRVFPQPQGLRVIRERGELKKKSPELPLSSAWRMDTSQDMSAEKVGAGLPDSGLRHMAAVATFVRSAVPCKIAAGRTIRLDPEMGMALWHTLGWKPLSVATFSTTGRTLCPTDSCALRPGVEPQALLELIQQRSGEPVRFLSPPTAGLFLTEGSAGMRWHTAGPPVYEQE